VADLGLALGDAGLEQLLDARQAGGDVQAGDAAGMGTEDRNCLVILKRWAQNQSFLRADVTVCLIAESLSALNTGLVQNPGVAAIEIPLPDAGEREQYILASSGDAAIGEYSDFTAAELAKLTCRIEHEVEQLADGRIIMSKIPGTSTFSVIETDSQRAGNFRVASVSTIEATSLASGAQEASMLRRELEIALRARVTWLAATAAGLLPVAWKALERFGPKDAEG
jgi:hypothetical protein